MRLAPLVVVVAGLCAARADAAGWREVLGSPAHLRLERAAAVSATRAAAVGDGVLYRLAGDRWVRVAQPYGAARDVVAASGALWVLVEGRGAHAGRAIVLRLEAHGGLKHVTSAALGQAAAPRALAVLGAGDLLVGGARPELARLQNGRVTPIAVAAPVVALCPARGGTIAADHGTSSSLVTNGAAQPLAPGIRARCDANGELVLFQEDGTVRRGGVQVAPAPPFPPTLVGASVTGEPVACGAQGACATFRRDLQSVEHTSERDRRMYFKRPRPPAWQPLTGEALPVEALAILPTKPLLLVGTRGEVATIERGLYADRAVPVVRVPRDDVLALVRLRDGALLLVTDAGLTRVTAAGARPLPLDPLTRRWLELAASRQDSRPPPIHATAIGGDGAVLFLRTVGLLVTAGGSRVFDVEALSTAPASKAVFDQLYGRGGQLEIVAVATSGDGRWVGATTPGGVLAGTGGGFRRLGSVTLGEQRTSWPVGAFRGSDGRVRIVDRRGPLVCVAPAGLVACGPTMALNPYQVHQLEDGLLVKSQEMRDYVVDEHGARAIAPLPVWRVISASGPAAAPLVLVQRLAKPRAAARPQESDFVREVLQLRGGRWEPVAAVPPRCVPEALEVSRGTITVACAGRVLLTPGAD